MGIDFSVWFRRPIPNTVGGRIREYRRQGKSWDSIGALEGIAPEWAERLGSARPLPALNVLSRTEARERVLGIDHNWSPPNFFSSFVENKYRGVHTMPVIRCPYCGSTKPDEGRWDHCGGPV